VAVIAVAYRCDICKEYCDDVHEISGLDIYSDIYIRYGVCPPSKIEIREVCDECYHEIFELVKKMYKR